MVQGTERIQDFIRQASSLHAVNTVYALGLSVVLIFCYHLVSSSGAEPPGELGAVTYATVALFAFKFLMQVSSTLQKLLKDEEFELVLAAGNAAVTFMLITALSGVHGSSTILALLTSFVPTLLFVLITPLTWRKKHKGFIGFFGFLEWILLLVVVYWLGSSIVDLALSSKYWQLTANAIVLSSPFTLAIVKKRYVKKLEERIHNDIYTDALTLVPNRMYFYDFYDKLRQDNKSSSLHADGIAVFFVDIDFFKKYNDFYGHDQGDECLKFVASELDNIAKEIGLTLFRIGGEEFVMLGQVTHEAWNEILKKDLIVAWEKGNFTLERKHEKSPLQKISLSAGASFVEKDKIYTMNAVGASKEADVCLYKAKSDGRAKLVVSNKNVVK